MKMRKTTALTCISGEKKEIENYLLNPAAIYRVVKSKKKQADISDKRIEKFIRNKIIC